MLTKFGYYINMIVHMQMRYISVFFIYKYPQIKKENIS
ncbi:MAG: hypothetical protein PWQ51_755 [Methanolobus sp.]|jgi:hypothetical protein|nr:hypothetical protein [Methanolobus sp.]MDK2938591.1 hypothetical protein [Methanolobus sp.]